MRWKPERGQPDYQIRMTKWLARRGLMIAWPNSSEIRARTAKDIVMMDKENPPWEWARDLTHTEEEAKTLHSVYTAREANYFVQRYGGGEISNKNLRILLPYELRLYRGHIHFDLPKNIGGYWGMTNSEAGTLYFEHHGDRLFYMLKHSVYLEGKIQYVNKNSKETS
jgi:hypothetical protein